MSEEKVDVQEEAVESEETTSSNEIKLNGLYAKKLGMSTIFDSKRKAIPVTVLQYDDGRVSEVKTVEKHGYSAVQVAWAPKVAKKAKNADRGHLKAAGFENGAHFTREIRQDNVEDAQVGQKVSIDSLKKGDFVTLTARSKGRGFAGTVKRFNFGGGPATHGAGFHRKPGSVGNRIWPGRVLPGKRMPGHYGNKNITVRGIEVVEVIPEENVLMLKGAVPGAQNTLVKMMKE